MNYMCIRSAASTFAVALSLAIFLGAIQPVLAGGGDFDNTFDGNGRLSTDFGLEESVTDMAVLPDGRIVTVGFRGESLSGGTVAVSRYLPNGALDTAFNDDGKATFTVGNSSSVAVAMMGSSIIVATTLSNFTGANTVYLLKYSSNGNLDTSFGVNGLVTTPLAANSSIQIRDMVIQNDFKILLVGGYGGTSSDWLLMRYNSSGSPDTGFSGDGRVETDFGGNTAEIAAGVALLPGGRILVAGTVNPAGQDFGLALYTTNGSLDTNWGGGDGKIVTDIGNSTDQVHGMAVLPNGRIVVVGRTQAATSQYAIVRYLADGTLDNSFSGDGKVTLDPSTSGTNDEARGVALQRDGKIVVTGTGGGDFGMVRFRTDGSLDSSFGQGGIVLSDMSNSSTDLSLAIKIQGNGYILLGGSCKNTPAGSTANFCVARYQSGLSGHADFDGDGKTDISVFRPSDGNWYLLQSTAGFFGINFGFATDKIVPADYDGDGKTDVAIYRPSEGIWYIANSGDSSYSALRFGISEDIPAPGDYDGDSKADLAVFRPSNGTWYIANSSNGTFTVIQFGSAGDVPTIGDFDADGRSDIAVFRPSNSFWYRINSGDQSIYFEQFGISTDKVVPGDYDGDFKTDLAVYRDGTWYVKRSSTGFSALEAILGTSTDIPAAGDYDGDGKTDFAVFRPSTGYWYIKNSSISNNFKIFPWGSNGDRPTPNAFGN